MPGGGGPSGDRRTVVLSQHQTNLNNYNIKNVLVLPLIPGGGGLMPGGGMPIGAPRPGGIPIGGPMGGRMPGGGPIMPKENVR